MKKPYRTEYILYTIYMKLYNKQNESIEKNSGSIGESDWTDWERARGNFPVNYKALQLQKASDYTRVCICVNS